MIHHQLAPAPGSAQVSAQPPPAASLRLPAEPISLPQTPVSVQSYSSLSSLPKSIGSAAASITVAVSSSHAPATMQLHTSQGHIVQKVPHGAVQFGSSAQQPSVRTVTTNNLPGIPTGATASQPPSFQRLKVEDALSYLDQVKFKFGSQPQVYNDFLDIMKVIIHDPSHSKSAYSPLLSFGIFLGINENALCNQNCCSFDFYTCSSEDISSRPPVEATQILS